MSKGNRVLSLRMSDKLILEVQADIEKLEKKAGPGMVTFSDWVRAACVERLAHRVRSRKTKKCKLTKVFGPH